MHQSHKSIGHFVSPLLLLAMGCGWLVLGPSPRLAVAGTPPGLRLSAAAEEEDPNIEILLAFLDLICALLGCDTGGDPLAPTSMLASLEILSPQAEAEMIDQINAYHTMGPLPTLSPKQRAQGRSDAQAFLSFLQTHRYLINQELGNGYIGMLSGLINDL